MMQFKIHKLHNKYYVNCGPYNSHDEAFSAIMSELKNLLTPNKDKLEKLAAENDSNVIRYGTKECVNFKPKVG